MSAAAAAMSRSGRLTRRLNITPPASARPNTTSPPARKRPRSRSTNCCVGCQSASSSSRPPCGLSAAGVEREDAADVLVVADTADLRQHAEGRRARPRRPAGPYRRAPGSRRLLAAISVPGDQDDLALRQSRQFLGQAVGEPVAGRQRAQHLVGEPRRDRHREEQLVAATDDARRRMSRAARHRAAAQAAPAAACRHRPSRVGQPRALGVGDDDEVRVELTTIAVGHRVDGGAVLRPAARR